MIEELPPECICVIRKLVSKNRICKKTNKPYEHTSRAFVVGCPVHTKRLY
jgi:hypothetical protein